jgi:hypothetical protein
MKIKKMKNLISLSLLVFSLFLFSCETETSPEFKSTSEDGEVVIRVQGTRSSSLDPYNVDISASIGDRKLEAMTEVYADSLTEENVSFSWSGNRQCVVRLTERDGQVKTVPIQVQDRN